MSLPEALEQAASALTDDADAIRPANGDPFQLLDALDDDAAVRVLKWLFENDPDAGEELAICWSEEDEGLVPLQKIDEAALPKKGRKALRKIHHRMRSAGIEVSQAQRSEGRTGRLPQIADSIDGAFVSPVDPGGGYLVFLFEPHPSSGARLFQLVLDEARGVVGFDVYSLGRSKLRNFLKKLRSASFPGAVEAEPHAVRALIRRIAEIHPSDRVLPRAFSEWRRKLVEDAGADSPGQQASEALEAATDGEAVGRVVERIEKGDLGPWPAPSGLLSSVGEALSKNLEELSELSDDEAESSIEGALEIAAIALFEGEHAEHTARRFEENAYALWKWDREEEARDCLAVAATVRKTRDATNPVIRALTRMSYGPAIERLRPSEKPDASETGSGS